MGRFDVACSFFRRLGVGVLHSGIDFDGTESALVNAKIPAVIGIVLELHNSVGQERGVREVSKCQFGEQQIAVAGDFKGSHFLSSDLEDVDCSTGEAVEDGFFQFFCEGEVGVFVVAGAPGVLLAVGADLDGHFHEGNLL